MVKLENIPKIDKASPADDAQKKSCISYIYVSYKKIDTTHP